MLREPGKLTPPAGGVSTKPARRIRFRLPSAGSPNRDNVHGAALSSGADKSGGERRERSQPWIPGSLQQSAATRHPTDRKAPPPVPGGTMRKTSSVLVLLLAGCSTARSQPETPRAEAAPQPSAVIKPASQPVQEAMHGTIIVDACRTGDRMPVARPDA